LARRQLRLIDGLETARANADGDPAAEETRDFFEQFGRCNEACRMVQTGRHIQKE
jgi:hypothetical protein